MNLLLLTQEEAALVGRPVNQPRMDTDRHGLDGGKVGRWEREKRSEGLGSECPMTNVQGPDTAGGFDHGRRRRGQASPFPPSDGGKDVVLTPAAGDPDAGGTRPYRGGEEEFLRLLFEFTHSVQLNPDRTIALAAKRWERTLRFRLAVTRQRRRDMNCTNWHENKRAEAMGTRRACPSQSGFGKGGKEAKGAT